MRPSDPGFEIYARRCASCHGDRAQGGSGPALVGHTVEQFMRQVRAPVGDMPMFEPDEFSDEAVAALIDYLDSLPAPVDAHGGHEHGVGLLAKQEVSQIVHTLALDAIDRSDVANAAHWLGEGTQDLSGTHLAAMQGGLAQLQNGDVRSARVAIARMVTDDASTRGWEPHELLLWLAMDSAERGDAAQVSHYLGHLERVENLVVAEIDELHESASRGDLAAVHAQIAAMLGLTDEPHVDDEADEPHGHEDEVDHHGEDVVDHDGEGLPPDEHEDEVADHDDEGLPPHEHEDEVADHDDEGLPPHGH